MKLTRPMLAAALGLLAANAQATQIDVYYSLEDVNCLPNSCQASVQDRATIAHSLTGSASAGGSFASSYADLATGRMGAYGSAAGKASSALGTVTIDETIHIQGSVTVPVTGILTTWLQGSLTPGSPPPFSGFSTTLAQAQLTVMSPVTTSTVSYNFQDRGCPPSGVSGGIPCINTTLIDQKIDQPFLITSTNRSFRFYNFLGAQGEYGGIADLSHTATMSLSLPAGLTYTSDSGVFLITSVPEPSSFWQIGVGLAVIGAAIGGKRRAGAAFTPAKV